MTRASTLAGGLAVIAAVAFGSAVATGYESHPPDGHDHVSGWNESGAAPSQERRSMGPERSHVALSAYLTGLAEIDELGNDGVGDPDAKGAAMLMIADERTICYGFSLRGADTPKAVHIHRAPAGRNGDPVITFANVPSNAAGPAGDPGASSGCKTLTAAGELAALRRLLAKPRGYYVNFHTASFPTGAVRGQLSRLRFDND